MNPADLTTIPPDFFRSDVYADSANLKDPEELAHFRTIVAAFFSYAGDCQATLQRVEKALSGLPDAQRHLLKYSPEEKLARIQSAICLNQNFLSSVVWNFKGLFDPAFLTAQKVPYNYVDKIRSVLLQVRREWSAEGAEERQCCFEPIIAALGTHFPQPKGIRVLVPGCGVGRLPYELAARGFSVQGNEFAYEMLLTSRFIMNELDTKHFQIVPKCHVLSNQWRFQDNLTPVTIPDLETFQAGDLSVVAGEFVDVYEDSTWEWDAVVTCFFLDTAHNVLEYLQVIENALKTGGFWVHFGPLQYHFTDVEGETSLELSWEEIEYAAERLGLQRVSSEERKSGYCVTGASMSKGAYDCVFSVFKKSN